MLERVFVVDGARTPFLKARGEPGPFAAADLAVAAGRALLGRVPAVTVDEVILGCVIPAADEANIARIVALRLGLPQATPAFTVQRNCASGLQAIATAASEIASGRAHVVLAGGTEAMSRAPLQWNAAMARWLARVQRARDATARIQALARFRPTWLKPVFALAVGLSDPVVRLSMGQTAEILAHRFGIARVQQDAYALASHQRLAAACDQGLFRDEIEPLFVGGKACLEDDGLRRDTDMGQLQRLRPVFDRDFGSVTSGNSSQVTDGAAMLLLASQQAVTEHRLPVLGEVVGDAWVGVDPAQMGLGPVHALSQLYQKFRLQSRDLKLVELNEAFAAQVLACQLALDSREFARAELGRDQALGAFEPSQLNVDGGAIAVGHPVGATGARLVLHLLHGLRRRGGGLGAASLCIGGGQGGAMLIRCEGS